MRLRHCRPDSTLALAASASLSRSSSPYCALANPVSANFPILRLLDDLADRVCHSFDVAHVFPLDLLATPYIDEFIELVCHLPGFPPDHYLSFFLLVSNPTFALTWAPINLVISTMRWNVPELRVLMSADEDEVIVADFEALLLDDDPPEESTPPDLQRLELSCSSTRGILGLCTMKLEGWFQGTPGFHLDDGHRTLATVADNGPFRRVSTQLNNKRIIVVLLVQLILQVLNLYSIFKFQVVGDVTKANTLSPVYFKDVKKVINTVSVIVGPKEGDTPDRLKYSQGIKFFEPEIKGDSPEKVEFIGMQNLIKAVKDSVGIREGKLLFGLKGNLVGKLRWGALDDVVMGGVSQSTFLIDATGSEDGGPTGIFKGVVSTANNGGFTSIRTKNFDVPEDLSPYDGLRLEVKGDGHRYKLIVRTSADWDTVGYTASFDTINGHWQTIQIPFSSLRPVFRARTVADALPFDPSTIISLQLMYSKFEYDGKLNPSFIEGAFQLPFSRISAYIKEPITSRFVHVSSAGVTRPERPGLDLSKQPPAVRLNKELDFILTYKLKGEDLIRESGIPYSIIRPCALTEEPAGADLIFDQGDNITGKISRDEVARICVAALESPYACDKTFEVKSAVPFSEPFTVDPCNPPPEKDYDEYFRTLKTGITGKESMEPRSVLV
ncbi:hypothetical protein KSP39_PZI024418 [Platanthera zijinensis]|uniref:NADH:ubiquinone oxidoreductase intermediate-associated protein 30 domain-containing protein n=1 Tax=Platanthera zijinensis TaxID=2320716 RepID=A0AAP0AU77_9ASPA